MKLKRLVAFDEISICANGSNFVAVDDDHSIGSFVASNIRVSFDTTPEANNFVKY